MAVVLDGTNTGIRGGRPFLTSDGTAWAVFVDSTSSKVMIMHDCDTTPVIAASFTATQANGGGPIGYFDACVDGDDTIHLVVAAEGDQTRDIAYNQYFPGSDSFGTWEEIAVYEGAPIQAAEVKIAIDEFNIPHVLWRDEPKYHGSPYSKFFYSVRTGGSWITKEQADDLADNVVTQSPMGIAILEGSSVRVMWGESVNYSERERIAGTWGSAITTARAMTQVSFVSHLTVDLNDASRTRAYVMDQVGLQHVYEDNVQKVTNVFSNSGQRCGAGLINFGASRFIIKVDSGDNNLVGASANNGTFSLWDLEVGTYTFVWMNYNTYHMHEDGIKVPYLGTELTGGTSIYYGEWVYEADAPPPTPKPPQQRTFPVIRPPRFPIRQLRI